MKKIIFGLTAAIASFALCASLIVTTAAAQVWTISASVSGSTVTFNHSAANGNFGVIAAPGCDFTVFPRPFDSGTISATDPTITVWNNAPAGSYCGALVFATTILAQTSSFTVTGSGGGGGSLDLGTINPGTSIPSVSGDPSSFVASAIRSSISLLIIVAFIVDLIWTIFGGIRFVTAGGDPKTVGAAWSQIYWGLIGMVVVMGSFAIIKLVETFFQVSIISGGFRLPTI